MTGLESIRPISDATIRGKAVDQLKELIVSGRLTAGARLTETELARAMGISRGPLREAVRELVDIGLLVSKPYSGLFVRQATRKDLDELYSLRTTLEQFAFRECWNKRTSAALSDLRARNAALTDWIDRNADQLGAVELELHLHSWCYEVSGHSLLAKSWERLKPNLQFYFALHRQAHNRTGPLREAHDVYIERACGDDLDAMLSHLETHMRQGLEKTLSFIDSETFAPDL